MFKSCIYTANSTEYPQSLSVKALLRCTEIIFQLQTHPYQINKIHLEQKQHWKYIQSKAAQFHKPSINKAEAGKKALSTHKPFPHNTSLLFPPIFYPYSNKTIPGSFRPGFSKRLSPLERQNKSFK